MTRRSWKALFLLWSVACHGGGPADERAPAPAAAPPVPHQSSVGRTLGARIFTDSAAPDRTGTPVVPPRFARDAGYMPLASAGVSAFRARYPTYDGRGVLVGVLDSGVDPSAAGLERTTTGAPKVIDLRDFSGEGKVPLSILPPPVGGSITVAGKTETGAGRIARLATNARWYGGELRIGDDRVPIVAVRASDGWVAFLDARLNGSFEDDTPLHDYRDGRETVAVGTRGIVVAANFADQGGVPALDLVFDDSGHGTHVAGVAAGHELFHLAGFDGVAPGAQVIGLKVTDNRRGGVSGTGSIVEALNYAAKFAADRGLPLVLSLSFAVRMPIPGGSAIDSLVDAFLLAHPEVVLTVAAGNDGPGLATIGSPAAADLALAVGSSLPLAFARPPNDSGPAATPGGDVMGWWSARGGLTAKPDLIVPGLAFSTVPAFAAGLELERGTSVGAPYVAGMAACLMSALGVLNRRVSAIEIITALRASATALAGTSFLDRGAGVPRLETAYRWLAAGHQGSDYAVRASDGNSAALRYTSAMTDSVIVFRVRHLAGRRAAEFTLHSSVPWLTGPSYVSAGAVETVIPVHVSLPPNLSPGVYTGSLVGRTPSDSAAGPLFTIVSTIVVPSDLASGPLVDAGRPIPAGRVQRYFLRLPGPGVTLAAQVTITGAGADTLARQVAIRLYGPGGLPVSGQAMQDRGPGVRYVVPGEEAAQGTYELDIAAPPLAGISATVRAEASRFRLEGRGNAIEAANSGTNSIAGSCDQALLGVSRNVVVNGSGAAPETLMVRVPGWATAATVRIVIPDSTWRELTGFALSTLDSAATRIATYALHNAAGAQSIPLSPSLQGRALLVELYPAFARSDAARNWQARVQITYMLPEPRILGSPRPVSLVAGERVDLPIAKPEPDGAGAAGAFGVPPGFAPFIEFRVHPTAAGNSGTETAVLHVTPAAAP